MRINRVLFIGFLIIAFFIISFLFLTTVYIHRDINQGDFTCQEDLKMKISIKSHHGKYLSAQPDGRFEWRDKVGEWEVFETGEVKDNPGSGNPGPGTPVPQPGDYNVDVEYELSALRFSFKPLCRMTATNNFAYAGEYADRRDDGGPGYKKHDRVAYLWRTDGTSWGTPTKVNDVESIHAMHANPMKNGINYATEHNCKVYSIADNGDRTQQYDFQSKKGVCIGAGDCGEYGQLVACSQFNGLAWVAGYRHDVWKRFYVVPEKFVWALTEYKGRLLAGCSYNPDFTHPNSGSIMMLDPEFKMIYDPPYGFCKGFYKKDNVLYAMFGGHLAWTEDLAGWPAVEMPGWACWSMIEGKPGTLIGIWYTDLRAAQRTGRPQGIWLVEFNIHDKSVKVIGYWPASGMTAPYYTGGGIVKLHNFGIGFITIGGKSRPLKVTW